MTRRGGEACCHLVGVVVTLVTIFLAITGLVLLILFSEGEEGHWAGIGIMIAAGVGALLTLSYSCYTVHSHWKLWGRININRPSSKLHQELRSRMSQIQDTPDTSVSSASPIAGAAAREEKQSKSLDWDPDKVLPDKNVVNIDEHF